MGTGGCDTGSGGSRPWWGGADAGGALATGRGMSMSAGLLQLTRADRLNLDSNVRVVNIDRKSGLEL